MAGIKAFSGRGVNGGRVSGRALVFRDGFTGWGGVDPQTGRICDRDCANYGQNMSGTVLVIPGSKGSNGWSCYLTATHVSGHGPAAMVVSSIDSSVGVALACMNIPAAVDFPPQGDPLNEIQNGDLVSVDGDTGIVEITREE